MNITVPAGLITLETPTSTMWLDETGILYSLSKENRPAIQTIEDIKVDMVKIREFTGNKKVCIIIYPSSNATPPPKNQRDFVAEQIGSITKAMAIISSSPLSRMVANLFFSFKPPAYPLKMFSEEKEAKEWIKQYLHT